MTTRRLVILALAALAFALGVPAPPSDAAPIDLAQSPSARAELLDLPSVLPEAKIGAGLLDLVESSDFDGAPMVVAQSLRPVDFSKYGEVLHEFTWPAGEHVAFLRLPVANAMKLATEPAVYAVGLGDIDLAAVWPNQTGDGAAASVVGNAEAKRELLRAAPAWGDAETARPIDDRQGSAMVDGAGGDDSSVDDWWDAGPGHGAREAWDMGFDGEGVRVAVLDFPIDYSHPDLQGTAAVLPEGHPYEGWPQVFDPHATFVAAVDTLREPNLHYGRQGIAGWIETFQESVVTLKWAGETPVGEVCFKPLAPPFGTGQPPRPQPETCDYSVPLTTKSLRVRFGHHPDSLLWPYGVKEGMAMGEFAGVLLVDENQAGVYDTVYVDLDGDHDFTDEKPMKKGDAESYRDMDGDGYADVSGGLLYWIADGETPFPASWTWGIENSIPAAGSAIAILHTNASDAGDHGTLCGTSVAAQGRMPMWSERTLGFDDLPDGSPPATNLGLAPGAGLVSIGNALWQNQDVSMMGASWRYVIFGHDRDRSDDDVQVASNSYGYSETDHDGWDPDSRLIDHYVREFNPNVSFLFSTGNGGPGYGTLAPPAPLVSLGIGASSQHGSTGGMDSIAETAQITYGDIGQLSNRGPGAIGRNGVHVAANGNDGIGGRPLNMAESGIQANVWWGGTSRSSPSAAGAMALVYDAFQAKHDRWPTWSEAQAILMSGARYVGYDTFTMGAGVVDAGDAARIASGDHGVYADPAEWTAGDYRGEDYPAFVHVLEPGASDTKSFTINNPSDEDVEVRVSAQTLRRVGTYDASIKTSIETDAQYGYAPDYLLEIDKDRVPLGADLMIVRGKYPREQFDAGMDYTYDNLFTFGVVQHIDLDGDGKLWKDLNGDGGVEHNVVTDSLVKVNLGGVIREIGAIDGAITPPVPEGGVTAPLVWYGRACVSLGDLPAGDVHGKLALIARGACAFTEKITNAQRDGAVGVIVFSDWRKIIGMGGDGAGIEIPGVMISNDEGIALRDQLVAGEQIMTGIHSRDVTLQGIGPWYDPARGVPPLTSEGSEIDPFEFMRINEDGNPRNHWAVTVHHPLERWGDGLYVAAWHTMPNEALSDTTIDVRYDFYAYEPWDAVSLSKSSMTVPAGGSADFRAHMWVDDDAPPGAQQGAIFVDYARPAANTVYLPMIMNQAAIGVPHTVHPFAGAYELPFMRTVIPVNVNVAPTYDWEGIVTLGGDAGSDPDAPYDNGTVSGHFNWNWRGESGDWRFFFIDAGAAPDNTTWIYKTTWDENATRQADIDTRVYGPVSDQFSDPDHPLNSAETDYPELRDFADPGWYGPHAMQEVVASPKVLLSGQRSVWVFDTTSGRNEDWLARPASEGLTEVMLHNVLFSGRQFSMPYRTEVASIRSSVSAAEIVSDTCGTFELTSQITLDDVSMVAYGLSDAYVFADVPILQEDPDDPAASAFKQDVTLGERGGRFVVDLVGDVDDDLDLWVLYDRNRDGRFVYPGEVVGQGNTPYATEHVELASPQAAGDYQVWVHGWRIEGDASTFDIDIDAVWGNQVEIRNAPTVLPAGEPVTVEVCADMAKLEGLDRPKTGTVIYGPAGQKTLLQQRLRWVPAR